MEKRFEIDFEIDWEYGVPITKLEKDLKELKKLGATNVDIESYISYDLSYISFNGYVIREETPLEIQERIASEKTLSNITKMQDMVQFNRIKKKYNL